MTATAASGIKGAITTAAAGIAVAVMRARDKAMRFIGDIHFLCFKEMGLKHAPRKEIDG